PERDYYFKTDPKSREIRDKFVGHVTAMFKLLGDPPDQAVAEARTVLDIETRFAKASRTPIELRDPVANYHRMSVAEAEKLTPHFSWTAFFKAQGAPPVPAVDVSQPEFFRAFDAILTSVPVDDWKVFLRWRAVHGVAASLGTPFVDENFRFDQIFGGEKENLPRWKRCVRTTDGS